MLSEQIPLEESDTHIALAKLFVAIPHHIASTKKGIQRKVS